MSYQSIYCPDPFVGQTVIVSGGSGISQPCMDFHRAVVSDILQ